MTMKTLINFFKRETVFCVSLLLAVISAFFVLPDAAYLTYPDYRTLALLFCLMIIVAGFQALGLFSLLGESLLKKAGSLLNHHIIFWRRLKFSRRQTFRHYFHLWYIGLFAFIHEV